VLAATSTTPLLLLLLAVVVGTAGPSAPDLTCALLPLLAPKPVNMDALKVPALPCEGALLAAGPSDFAFSPENNSGSSRSALYKITLRHRTRRRIWCSGSGFCVQHNNSVTLNYCMSK
jgi:hypothetical protein